MFCGTNTKQMSVKAKCAQIFFTITCANVHVLDVELGSKLCLEVRDVRLILVVLIKKLSLKFYAVVKTLAENLVMLQQ